MAFLLRAIISGKKPAALRKYPTDAEMRVEVADIRMDGSGRNDMPWLQ